MPTEHETYPFVMDTVPEEFLRVAQQDLNETPEKREECLQDLITKAKSDKTLKDLDLQPDFLLPFLRVSKFKVDVAFRRLQKYIHYRKKHPSFFQSVQDNILNSPSFKWASPLPWRSPDGCVIGVLKYGVWDPRHISYENLHRGGYILVHEGVRCPVSQINGLKLILDFKNTSFRHLKYGTPGRIYDTAQMYMECFPIRFKQFHCVNCTDSMKIAWTIVAQFMSEKLRKRVIFHRQPEELLNFFPKHILPVEYGGDIEDFYMHSWVKEANHRIGISTLNEL